jgi:protein-S-isoprenylcysteine O-methyltransferase Ste14
MTIFGIGPKLLGLILAYSIIPAALTMAYPGFFAITSVPPGILYFVGGILLALGLPLWLLSIFPLLKGFTQGKLCTTGVYSIVRNPMYSAYIVFLVPAVVLFFRSWIMLTIPMVMYLIFKKLIRAEELYLEGQFGEEYLKYKSAVNLLIPSFKSFKLNPGAQ